MERLRKSFIQMVNIPPGQDAVKKKRPGVNPKRFIIIS